jgi:MFS transporter, ACS family, glucarate transporter
MTRYNRGDRSRKRPWFILLMLLVFSIVTYLDRVNISIAAKYIMPEYGFNSVEMGTVFSALVFGYALFQIPGGWMGDRFGPRKVLTAAVIWWSIFTALTAVAGKAPLTSIMGTLNSFILIRFLIGVGEGMAVPTYNRVIANWMAPTERAFASSFVLSGMGIGGAITPPLIAWVMITLGWQVSFYICALVGIIVGVIWYRYTTDNPPEPRLSTDGVEAGIAKGDTGSSETEEEILGNKKVPWKAILTDSNVWLITLSQIFAGYVASVFTYWFYLYLVDVRGFSILGGSFYAMGPFIAAAILPPFGGILSDRLVQKYGKRLGRRATVIGFMSLTAILVLLGNRAQNPYVAILMLSLGTGCVFAAITSYWATVVDIGKQFSGTVTGITVMGANIGGTVAPTLTPMIAKHFGWTAALDFAALAALIAGSIWLVIRPEKELSGGAIPYTRSKVSTAGLG